MVLKTTKIWATQPQGHAHQSLLSSTGEPCKSSQIFLQTSIFSWFTSVTGFPELLKLSHKVISHLELMDLRIGNQEVTFINCWTLRRLNNSILVIEDLIRPHWKSKHFLEFSRFMFLISLRKLPLWFDRVMYRTRVIL